MYGEDTFKPPALQYSFGIKAKQEVVPLGMFQEITGLLGSMITSMMVALVLVKHRLKKVAKEYGEDLATDIIITLEELDSPAFTCLGHAPKLTDSSFNSLSEKRRKKTV